MKRLLLAVALALPMLQAARAAECDDARSQAEMQACAANAYKASDAELNAVYRQIEKRLAGDKDTLKLLVRAQRAWLGFRDAECGFSSSGAEGGSVHPTVVSMCLDDLTRKRVDGLKGYLDCGEGDTSCPVPAADADTAGPVPGFTIDLSLSPKALKTLSERKEKVIVDARYYGYPKPSARQHGDDVGQIQLGTEDVETAPRPGAVRVTGANVLVDRLDWIDGDIMVNVNGFTARKSGPDNLIDCDFIDGRLAAVTAAPVTLHCALIEENYETKQRP